MKLERPIIVFDLETTGVDVVKDRIVQIGIRKIMPDGTERTKSVLVNPTMLIPPGAMAVHKITDEMVATAPTFKQIAVSMYEYFNGCDLMGFNSDRFDIPLLSEEFNRCGITFPGVGVKFVDIYKLEKKINSHKLTETYKRYTGKELEGAHDALNDVNGTWDVFKAQVEKYDLPTDIEGITSIYSDGNDIFDLAGKMYIKDGTVNWSFGKNKDKPVTDDMGYTNWFLSKDFPTDSKNKLREHLAIQKDLDR